MKRRHTRTVTCGALIATALLSGACGGDRKSGDAGAAHQHGTSTTATAMDHSAHATSTDPHAGMNHGSSTSAAAVDHSAHGGGAAVDHAAMGHGTAADPHAGHGSNAPAGAGGHASMDHGSMNHSKVDHSKMDHSKMDHAAMGHTTQKQASHGNAHAGHAAAARGNAHAQHGTARGDTAHADAHGQHQQQTTRAHTQHNATQHTQHNATQHTQHNATQHTQHNATQHTQHNATNAPADPHAQHGTAAPRGAHAGHGAHGAHGATPSPAPALAAAPRSSSELQRVQPAATLRPDAFDAPAPAAISEARKATQGGGHEGHATRGITPGEDHANPPTPMPATRDRSNTPASGIEHEHHGDNAAQTRGAKPAEEAAVYFCPMDTEVTSARPGNCPKCGMALVKKD